jgi:hypothetical protein
MCPLGVYFIWDVALINNGNWNMPAHAKTTGFRGTVDSVLDSEVVGSSPPAVTYFFSTCFVIFLYRSLSTRSLASL